MVSVHELASLADDHPGPHLELVQDKKVEGVVTVRCPSCDGLRAVHRRHATRTGTLCGDCRRGEVIRREDFYDFWLEQFTPDDIKDMGAAIDALLCLRIR